MFGVVSLAAPGRGNVEESRKLMLKLIDTDPGNKDAYYAIGALDWTIVYGEIREALARLGASPAVGQVPDAGERATLRSRNAAYLEEGFRVLQIALEKNPESDVVMAYLNLMHRAKGLTADDPQETASEIALADQWVGKALQAIRAKARRPKEANTIDLNGEPPVITPVPPPPPPPPPPGTAPLPRNPKEGVPVIILQ